MAPRAGFYAVLAHGGTDAPNLTGFRFRSRDRALAAAHDLREQHPGACLAYRPTAADRRRYEAQPRDARETEVRFWGVCRTGHAIGEPLRPMYANEDQARRALAHLRGTHADAYLLMYSWTFNLACAGDRAEWDEVLACMAPLEH